MVDLPKQGRSPSAITRATRGQRRGDDLTRAGVNGDVQLPPRPVLRWPTEMAHVNPEPRTVDQNMDGSIASARVERNRTESPSAPGERRVIRNGKIHLELIGQ